MSNFGGVLTTCIYDKKENGLSKIPVYSEGEYLEEFDKRNKRVLFVKLLFSKSFKLNHILILTRKENLIIHSLTISKQTLMKSLVNILTSLLKFMKHNENQEKKMTKLNILSVFIPNQEYHTIIFLFSSKTYLINMTFLTTVFITLIEDYSYH